MPSTHQMVSNLMAGLDRKAGMECLIETIREGYRACFESQADLAKYRWFPCHKKEYDIQVYVPPIGTTVYNKLEGARYVTNETKPFVLVGTAGEEWTVDAKKIMKAYKYEHQPITEEVIKTTLGDGKKHTITAIAGAERMFAAHTTEQVEVNTSWGETLQANRPGVEHGAGDYLVCSDSNGSPNLNDVWIVNGAIFPKTYTK